MLAMIRWWRFRYAVPASSALGMAVTAAAALNLAEDTQPMEVTVFGYSPQGTAQNLDYSQRALAVPQLSELSDGLVGYAVGVSPASRRCGLLPRGGTATRGLIP